MAFIRPSKGWEISENLATPESVFMNRRDFLKGTTLAGLGTALALYGCGSEKMTDPNLPLPMNEIEKSIYPAAMNPAFILDRGMTDERVAASYNNFYEFSEIKEDVKVHAQRLEIRPWPLEVRGLVNKPETFGIDDILKTFPLEERLYRHRCVEAWAMAVPWTGFPMKALMDRVEPKPAATHVQFTAFYAPFTAQGQLGFWQPWPYVEALTIDEAANDLTLLATGIYGHPLPKQHGAPIRLVVPWKYGFKSIKSIVSIEFVDYPPPTFWNVVQPYEYSFEANVDPNVPHPRWPQKKEKMIGTGEVRPTLLYNGYEKFVGHLYKS